MVYGGECLRLGIVPLQPLHHLSGRLGVWVISFKVQALGSRVLGLGFRAKGLGVRVGLDSASAPRKPPSQNSIPRAFPPRGLYLGVTKDYAL